MRPDLVATLTPEEFDRWYWTCADLRTFCRAEGLPVGGVKGDLVDRVRACLAGAPAPPPRRPRRPPAGPLPEPVDDRSVLPPGQRATRQLRTYLEQRVGAAFRVDQHVRDFLEHQDGATVGDLVAHWEATRGRPAPGPAAQFEYNRFSVAWHESHPGGTAAACRAAWREHRSLPVDERPGPGAGGDGPD